MIKHSEKIAMSLNRMREVVFNHHQASMVEPPQDARYQRMNGYDHEAQSNYGDDTKGAGGFSGPDAKKARRGVSLPKHNEVCHKLIPNKPLQRAAPPGRCHSCNRAETPEWRRGPDGARTLCNACGLRKLAATCPLIHRLTVCRLRKVDSQNGRQAEHDQLKFTAQVTRSRIAYGVTTPLHHHHAPYIYNPGLYSRIPNPYSTTRSLLGNTASKHSPFHL